MSDFLRQQGIAIQSPYDPSNLKNPDCVVIGNALSRGNPEVEYVLANRLAFCSLPELLRREVLSRKLPIVVTGTHGKTTTTAAVAHVLDHLDISGGHMVGGLPVGQDAGFAVKGGDWFAIEGDEYDTAFFDKRPKFLHYQPQVVILNNLEFDHADIYGSFEEIRRQFHWLIRLIPQNGCLIVNADEPALQSLADEAPCPVITYGQGTSATVRSELNGIGSAGMQFRLTFSGGQRYDCRSELWGVHQLMNLTAAAAAAEFAGGRPEQIVEGLTSFKGVHRRLEQKYSDGSIWLFDDFAHHPTAIRAALRSLRARFPDYPIIAAFEPRSNTMVHNYLQAELVEALSEADLVAVGKIHRESSIEPGSRLDLHEVADRLTALGKETIFDRSAEEIAEWISTRSAARSVVVVMTNGAFGGLTGLLYNHLTNR